MVYFFALKFNNRSNYRGSINIIADRLLISCGENKPHLGQDHDQVQEHQDTVTHFYVCISDLVKTNRITAMQGAARKVCSHSSTHTKQHAIENLFSALLYHFFRSTS